MVASEFGTNPTSVIPSDYCYNRFNIGIPFRHHLFVRVARKEFKFVGEDYPYSGRVFWRPKGHDAEVIVGEWQNGTLSISADPQGLVESAPVEASRSAPHVPKGLDVLSRGQIQKLYEEYLELLHLETDVFGVKVTEVKHLIGRIGEFKCALLTNGSLAHEANQHGFDVVAGRRRISVKTTAQKNSSVRINKGTIHKVDDLMILQYDRGEFGVVYHGDIQAAIECARTYEGKFELDISKAKRLMETT